MAPTDGMHFKGCSCMSQYMRGCLDQHHWLTRNPFDRLFKKSQLCMCHWRLLKEDAAAINQLCINYMRLEGQENQ